uniref:Uncharacterized protein ORFX n=1 Tax=Serratia marcescens TaxID=615 RepID=Q8GHL0_SERMA|nr:hypothetical protein [Serratia marcescens]
MRRFSFWRFVSGKQAPSGKATRPEDVAAACSTTHGSWTAFITDKLSIERLVS